uniref:Uncharacterized protein n=1 Tax=Candidatus Kentrum sp. DK TaxID=2126562 RepID=A0A450SXT6_9GAMM|nr:MAG: hypothetical protein BECKDK2373C_GA0170839_106718 [Candidatus Kentron sp. DK]
MRPKTSGHIENFPGRYQDDKKPVSDSFAQEIKKTRLFGLLHFQCINGIASVSVSRQDPNGADLGVEIVFFGIFFPASNKVARKSAFFIALLRQHVQWEGEYGISVYRASIKRYPEIGMVMKSLVVIDPVLQAINKGQLLPCRP